MLVENQLVEVKWCNPTRKWYEDRGYVFTNQYDVFMAHIRDLQPTSTYKVKAICDYCGNIIMVKYGDYLKHTKNETLKYACSKCGSKKHNELYHDKEKYYNKFCELCIDKGYIPVSTKDEYINAHEKLKFKCPIHGIQEITYMSLASGCGCNLCGYDSMANKHRLSPNEVTNIVESKNGNYLINPEDYINAKINNLKIVCGMCGRVFTTSLSSIINAQGSCYDCRAIKTANHHRLSPNEVESMINSINDNTLLNKNEYKGHQIANLQIQCGKCGEIYTTSLSMYIYAHVDRCPKCSKRISKGEQLIMDILDRYKVNYIYQFPFDDCRDKQPLPYDFYLPNYNLCIEFDGPQHFEPKYGEKQFRITKLHDAMKDWYCRWNDIDLLRIPYWEGSHLEEILVEKLNLNNNDISQNFINAKSNSQSQKIKYIPNRKTA